MMSTAALLVVKMTGDLSLAALLSGSQAPVIGWVLLDWWQQGSFGDVAAAAVIMTAASSAIVAVLLLVGRPRYR